MGLVTPGHKLVRTSTLDTEDTGVITTQIRTNSSPRHFMGTPDPAWHCPGHGSDNAHINMWRLRPLDTCISDLEVSHKYPITAPMITTIVVQCNKQSILRNACLSVMTIKRLARVLISCDSTLCVYLGHVWLGAECSTPREYYEYCLIQFLWGPGTWSLDKSCWIWWPLARAEVTPAAKHPTQWRWFVKE